MHTLRNSILVGIAIALAVLLILTFPTKKVLCSLRSCDSVTRTENTTELPHLVDVRSGSEFAAEHLEGAILIPYDNVSLRVPEIFPNLDTPLQLYCRTGHRASIALSALKKMGYTNVTNLGGMNDIMAQLEKPAP
ncbi:MAG TPA: rhodanese-like domain-containing protein [Rhodospirillaceae bacterium]|nr:MAG: hypothetical protein A2018_05435 [Alphaproteobacteria bacterium GWF2_58_20]HAU28958.1 rhodanese-like domain-containing protein [Rhodospirillaceae bacterium]